MALVGGVAFLLTNGDDEDEGENASPNSDQTTTTAADPDNAESEENTDTTTTLPEDELSEDEELSEDAVASDTLDVASQWVYDNTPEGVDELESECIAGAVIGVVGPSLVDEAGGDLTIVYTETDTTEDEAISAALPSCVDSESLTALQGDGWPWV